MTNLERSLLGSLIFVLVAFLMFIGTKKSPNSSTVMSTAPASSLFRVQSETHDGGYRFHRIEMESHVYIGINYGGIVHAESCPCKVAK